MSLSEWNVAAPGSRGLSFSKHCLASARVCGRPSAISQQSTKDRGVTCGEDQSDQAPHTVVCHRACQLSAAGQLPSLPVPPRQASIEVRASKADSLPPGSYHRRPNARPRTKLVRCLDLDMHRQTNSDDKMPGARQLRLRALRYSYSDSSR